MVILKVRAWLSALFLFRCIGNVDTTSSKSASLNRGILERTRLPLKTAILVHGCHLDADCWEDIVWGDPNTQKMGRLPHAIMMACLDRADLVVLGTGGSERGGVKEGAFTLKYMKRNLGRLLAFDFFRDPVFRRRMNDGSYNDYGDATISNDEDVDDATFLNLLARRLDAICVCETESCNTVEELEQSCRLFQRANVERVVLVSSPTHMPRCLRDAAVVFGKLGFQPMGGYLASPSATCYAGTHAKDVCVIEPGHRGDRDRRLDAEDVALHELCAKAVRVPRPMKLAFAQGLAKLLSEHTAGSESKFREEVVPAPQEAEASNCDACKEGAEIAESNDQTEEAESKTTSMVKTTPPAPSNEKSSEPSEPPVLKAYPQLLYCRGPCDTLAIALHRALVASSSSEDHAAAIHQRLREKEYGFDTKWAERKKLLLVPTCLEPPVEGFSALPGFAPPLRRVDGNPVAKDHDDANDELGDGNGEDGCCRFVYRRKVVSGAWRQTKRSEHSNPEAISDAETPDDSEENCLNNDEAEFELRTKPLRDGTAIFCSTSPALLHVELEVSDFLEQRHGDMQVDEAREQCKRWVHKDGTREALLHLVSQAIGNVKETKTRNKRRTYTNHSQKTTTSSIIQHGNNDSISIEQQDETSDHWCGQLDLINGVRYNVFPLLLAGHVISLWSLLKLLCIFSLLPSLDEIKPLPISLISNPDQPVQESSPPSDSTDNEDGWSTEKMEKNLGQTRVEEVITQTDDMDVASYEGSGEKMEVGIPQNNNKRGRRWRW
eukprot:CAMPEP_0171724970 /NCGR_PEP_ID=MMETSP0991-20121206/24699_1 /TAXON_ID=483369 /ORGANISM="non described non described, Strain CCMP2098" /LENGTH=775 /DNA_ID=CAMNT_0012317987 /DNA_START=138 /DNA_END=2462 /DNA_ORIENTATION=-